jgi:hypothetical protein
VPRKVLETIYLSKRYKNAASKSMMACFFYLKFAPGPHHTAKWDVFLMMKSPSTFKGSCSWAITSSILTKKCSIKIQDGFIS